MARSRRRNRGSLSVVGAGIDGMSSSTSTIDRGHPITVAAAQMRADLKALEDQSTWSMTDEETRTTLCQLTRLAAQVAELELRVAAHAEANRVGDTSGATSA